jgi:hypothetical protein
VVANLLGLCFRVEWWGDWFNLIIGSDDLGGLDVKVFWLALAINLKSFRWRLAF